MSVFIFALNCSRGAPQFSIIGGVLSGVARFRLLSAFLLVFSAFRVVLFAFCGGFFRGWGVLFRGWGVWLVSFFFVVLSLFFGSLMVAPSSSPRPVAPALPSVAVLFPWFALAFQRISPAPGFRFSERVAAACPRFACWLCGRFGVSWSVAWGAACACAARVGVAVGSGALPRGGVQLSLFS